MTHVSSSGSLQRVHRLLRALALVVSAVVIVPHAQAGTGTSPEDRADVIAEAPNLPRATAFTGPSILDTRLSTIAYSLTKLIGAPKTVDVACWSKQDWAAIATDGDPLYSTTGLYLRGMPHWVHLSPGVCRAMETLLRNRPEFPNIYTADAVDTLTHEMMHAIGVRSEAAAECFGMQLTPYMAIELGVPKHYSIRLGQLSLQNYGYRPTKYRDLSRCREDGAWDLFKDENSLPWHSP